MKSDIPLNPRKRPQQARSAETVGVILQAAAQVLEAQGAKGTTTNKIAERAGVSIGSLYEYFPNKSSIFAELEHQFHLRLANELRRVVHDPIPKTLDQTVSACVRVVVNEHARHAQIHSAAPSGSRDEDLDHCVAGLAMEVFSLHADELQPSINVGLAQIVCLGAIEAGVHAALEKRPEALRDGTLESELSALVIGYLRSGTGAGRG